MKLDYDYYKQYERRSFKEHKVIQSGGKKQIQLKITDIVSTTVYSENESIELDFLICNWGMFQAGEEVCNDNFDDGSLCFLEMKEYDDVIIIHLYHKGQ